MVKIMFPIDRRPIKCPKCNKYQTPTNMIILKQNFQTAKFRCSFCGHEWEEPYNKPDFYTII